MKGGRNDEEIHTHPSSFGEDIMKDTRGRARNTLSAGSAQIIFRKILLVHFYEKKLNFSTKIGCFFTEAEDCPKLVENKTKFSFSKMFYRNL